MHRIRNFKYIINLRNIAEEKKCIYELFFGCRIREASSEYRLIKRTPIRNTPVIMKLDTPQFKACITEEVKVLNDLFTKNGYEVRIVGGAVRDLLMGIQPKDLDFSTTATPDEMKRIFTENAIRILNTNGEKHGTITSRINETNFEVTTLRIDVATNGRHAEVAFVKDWVLDANRRDLTINAMYLALDGTLYDYFNGIEDLKNKRIAFVGNASHRIQEDYLRILRYFRFYGAIAEAPDSHDKDIIQAIRENAFGLSGISGERIWVELIKILKGKFVDDIIVKMISLGIGSHIGFPEKPNIAEFKRVIDSLKMKDMSAKPITILLGLFNNKFEFDNFYLRIKASNIERDLGYFLLGYRSAKDEMDIRSYKILLLKNTMDFVCELMKYNGQFDLLEEIKAWELPTFPVKGTMLKELGFHGKELGETLEHLKDIWCNHDFNLSAEELLKHVSSKKLKVKYNVNLKGKLQHLEIINKDTRENPVMN